MDMMSIKELAERENVTYEAIRKSVARYSEELKPHIIRKNRTQYLDQWAIDFLKQKRRENPIILMSMDANEQNEQLKVELENMTKKFMAAQEEIIRLQKAENAALEAKIKFDLLQESHERVLEDLKQSKAEASQTAEELKQVREQSAEELKQLREQSAEELKQAQSEAAELSIKLRLAEIDKEKAEQEAQSFHKTWFGLYRKS